jgi:hypothetical protein
MGPERRLGVGGMTKKGGERKDGQRHCGAWQRRLPEYFRSGRGPPDAINVHLRRRQSRPVSARPDNLSPRAAFGRRLSARPHILSLPQRAHLWKSIW